MLPLTAKQDLRRAMHKNLYALVGMLAAYITGHNMLAACIYWSQDAKITYEGKTDNTHVVLRNLGMDDQ